MFIQDQTDKDKGYERPVVPDGIKMIAILNYIGFGFMALIGLILLVLGVFLILTSGVEIIKGVDGEGYYLLYVMGGFGILLIFLFFVCFTILLFFIGRGLWQLKNWARIACVVIGCLGIIVGIKNFVQGLMASADGFIILSLLIISFNALIAGYLLFNRKVREAFS